MNSEDELAVPSWPLRHARLHAALLCSALACLLPTLHADAQAMPTASKSNDISAFVGGSYSNPQYGPEQDKGITFGANLIEHLHFPVSPSIEGRANITSGAYIGERSYLGGLRVQGDVLHYLHPYGDFRSAAAIFTSISAAARPTSPASRPSTAMMSMRIASSSSSSTCSSKAGASARPFIRGLPW